MIKIRSGYFYSEKFLPLRIDVDENDASVVRIHFLRNAPPVNREEENSPLLNDVKQQLEEYFNGSEIKFDIPIKFITGTPFQMRVWRALKQIPYGEVVSYKQLAEFVGLEKGYRAIGMANHYNPIPIVVPCHRVINHSGELGGYAPGVKWKTKLLELERIPVLGNKIKKPLFHLIKEVNHDRNG